MFSERIVSPNIYEKTAVDELEHNDGDSNAPLLEKDREHPRWMSPRSRISLATHAISIVIILSLLMNTIIITQETRKNCVRSFNAYCKPGWSFIREDAVDLIYC